MDFHAFYSLILFIAFMVATPGPANLLAMLGGKEHGFVKCVPFLTGLLMGKFSINIFLEIGVAFFLWEYPKLLLAFKFACGGLMILLGLRSWKAAPATDSNVQKAALGFFSGVLTHLLNPKAWTMGMIAWTDYAEKFLPISFLVIAGSFFFLQLVFHSLWCCMGVLMKKTLPNSLWLTRSLVILMILVVLFVLFD